MPSPVHSLSARVSAECGPIFPPNYVRVQRPFFDARPVVDCSFTAQTCCGPKGPQYPRVLAFRQCAGGGYGNRAGGNQEELFEVRQVTRMDPTLDTLGGVLSAWHRAYSVVLQPSYLSSSSTASFLQFTFIHTTLPPQSEETIYAVSVASCPWPNFSAHERPLCLACPPLESK